MAKCKDCKYYGVCILDRRSADAEVSGCKIYEMGERDLVEVVRCKDCESYHFGRCWNGACGGLGASREANDFCSYGERREGE